MTSGIMRLQKRKPKGKVAPAGGLPGRPRSPSQLPQERYQVCLLLLAELQFLDEIEELDGVLQCQTAAVVEVRRAVLDAPQREGLDGPVSCFVLEEPLQMEVMHLVIEVKRRRMADGALRLAKEQLLPPEFALGGLGRV